MAAYADTAAVNLAGKAVDGMHIHIPYDWNGVPPPSVDDGKVSLNQADAEQLMTLPGIGPAMADNIIAYRREHGAFTNIDELKQVKGIGPAKFQKLKDQVAYESPFYAASVAQPVVGTGPLCRHCCS